MQQERTAETVSEKRRRGRRPAFPLGEDAAITAVWGGLITTKRSLRNKQYCVEGARAICPEGQRTARYAWFANDQRCRQAVLVELGRIAMRYGDATARSMADELAHKAAAGELSTTREAAAWLRQARLRQSGTRKPATADALEKVITTTIITWMAEHPDATPALVAEALSGAHSLPEVLEDLRKPIRETVSQI